LKWLSALKLAYALQHRIREGNAGTQKLHRARQGSPGSEIPEAEKLRLCWAMKQRCIRTMPGTQRKGRQTQPGMVIGIERQDKPKREKKKPKKKKP